MRSVPLKTVNLKYTAYGDLKEGDEFVRFGMLPVLVTDLPGKRAGGFITPSTFGQGKPLEIFIMVNVGSHMRELSVSDELRVMKQGPEWNPGEEPDAIVPVKVGFKDGFGDDYTAPPNTHGAVKVGGVWYWWVH